MSVLFAGLTTLDIHYFIDEFPQPNVKVKSEDPSIYTGGPATNAAVAYAFLSGKENTSLITAIGKNVFKPGMLNDLKEHGVSIIDIGDDQDINPILASVITTKSNGDRTIFTHHPIDIKTDLNVKNIFSIQKPELLMIDGFYPRMSKKMCEEAKNRGIPVVFDGGSWKEHLPDLLPYVDIAICSANFHPPNCNTDNEIIEFLKSYGINKIAISKGSNPIVVWENEKQSFIKIVPSKIKDSLGAGDFLHGAFCYYWLKENDFIKSLELASRLASETCMHEGTRDWLKKINKNSFL